MNLEKNAKIWINKFLYLQRQYKKIAAQSVWDMSDIYLVSYPKSGTTWICLIIANIIGKVNKDCRRIDLFSVHDYVPDFHANPERIIQMQPPRVIKTHENFDDWYRRICLRGKNVVFPRVIYLVRDGRDAMISYYHYVKALQGYDGGFAKFINDKKNPRGDWGKHVDKWVVHNAQLDNRELLLIKYEDLRKNTLEEIKKVIDFIGLEANDHLLQAAIRDSYIENIRYFENKFGGGVKYKNRGYRFARKGSHGSIEADFKAAADLYFNRNSEIFQFLGYN